MFLFLSVWHFSVHFHVLFHMLFHVLFHHVAGSSCTASAHWKLSTSCATRASSGRTSSSKTINQCEESMNRQTSYYSNRCFVVCRISLASNWGCLIPNRLLYADPKKGILKRRHSRRVDYFGRKLKLLEKSLN